MAQFVFVFSAAFEDHIAFSVRADGSNLPPPSSGSAWMANFRTTLSIHSIGMFGCEPKKVAQGLREQGFYIALPQGTRTPRVKYGQAS